MAVFDLFSKRLKRLKGEHLDPFQYDKLPEAFRIQLIHILKSATGDPEKNFGPFVLGFWKFVHDTLCRELGRFHLSNSANLTTYKNCLLFVMNEKNTSNVLDFIDCSFQAINTASREIPNYALRENGIEQSPDEAIDELNHRFKEHSIGYQFENGELVRVDSQFIHQEAIKPAIALLSENDFKGAEEEFFKAYEHFRHSRNKEAIAEALKSFESTMKIICDRRKWPYKPGDTANKLIEIIVSNDLIPPYLQQVYTSLRSTLEAGVPVLRNKTSGHGQGEQILVVPEHFVSYTLHLTASSIVFLVECHLNKN